MTAPTLAGLASSVTFNEDAVNAAPALLDIDVALYDAENNLAGGTLTVTGLLAEDRIGVRHQGIAAGEFGVLGSDVSYGGVVIGTVSGGVGAAFTVALNGAATTAAVEALIENLTYANTSDAPTASRTLTLNVADADGADLRADGRMSFEALGGADSPFSGIDVGRIGKPEFVDFDGDGDPDMVVGEAFGSVLAYRNDGGVFTQLTGSDNPFSGITAGNLVTVAFGNFAGDGRPDLVIGDATGQLFAYRNDNGAFTQLTGAANPFNGYDIGAWSDPVFADYDGDGDVDLIIGSQTGEVFVSRRNGSTFAAPVTLGVPFPFSFPSSPAFLDFDGDGDQDLVVAFYDHVRTFRNDGAGAYTRVFDIPFRGLSGARLGITFADLDGDGDLDGIAGEDQGGIIFLENAGQSITVNVTPVNEAPVAQDDALTAREDVPTIFTAAQLVGNDTDVDGGALTIASVTAVSGGTPVLNADGSVTFTAAPDFNGTASFTYVVQDGRGGTDEGLVTVDVAAVNDAPKLTGFSPGATFDENAVNAAPALLDADVTFGDAEGNVAGGVLTVTGLLAEDIVGIRDQGAGAGQIGVSGSEVSYGGVVIGTVGGGAGTTLTVALNSAATVAAVEALIENLTYANTSDAPTASRTLTLSVADADGADLRADGRMSFEALGGADSPFSGIDVGRIGKPEFVDFDGDGDPDMVVGEAFGSVLAYRNDGGVFTQLTGSDNPFSGITAGNLVTVAFGNFAGDGRPDLVIGDATGQLFAYRNDNGAFTQLTGAANPFNGYDIGAWSDPVFADYDGDGDVDLIIGSQTGEVFVSRRNGSTFAAPVTLGVPFPFSFPSSPAFLDFDGDGDQDLVVAFYDHVRTFRNDGAGAYTRVFDIPFRGLSGARLGITFADLDGDGDLDGIAGEDQGGIIFLENAGQSITVNVTPVSDRPQTSDRTVTLVEDAAHTFSLADFAFADAEGNSFTRVALYDAPANGALWLDADGAGGAPAVRVQPAPGTPVMVATSIIAAGGLTFVPDANGNGAGYASFHFAVEDDGGTANGGSNLSLPHVITLDVEAVTEPPVNLIGSGTITLNEDASASIIGLAITDADPAGATFTVTLAVEHGSIAVMADVAGGVAAAGIVVGPAGSTTLTGTLTQINTTLAVADAVRYTPAADHFGADTLTMTTSDGEANDVDTRPIAVIAVNDAPSFVPGADIVIDEDSGFVSIPAWATSISAGPANEGGQGLSLSANVVAGGRLLSEAPSINVVTGKLTFALRPDVSGTISVDVVLSDDDGNGSHLSTPVHRLTITVTPVNDAPVHSLPTSRATVEGEAVTLIPLPHLDPPGIVVTDVDSAMLTTRVTVADGSLSVGPAGASAIISGDGTNDLLLSGTAEDVNRALYLVSYTPAAGVSGVRTITVTTSDGSLSDVDTVSVSIADVGIAPAGEDVTRSTLEDVPIVLGVEDFPFTDVEGQPLVAIRLASLPTAGTLRHADGILDHLDVDGDGVPDVDIRRFELRVGEEISRADLEAGRISYVPAANASGSTSFTFQVRDAGGPDFGEALDASPNTFTIEVAPVYDPPSLSGWGPEAGAAVWDQSALSTNVYADITGWTPANDFTLTLPQALTGFTVYLTESAGSTADDGVFGGFSGTLGWGLYTNTAGGEPGSLLYSGTDLSLIGTDTGVNSAYGGKDVYRFEGDFGQTIVLLTGTYWFGIRETRWGGDGADGSVVGWASATAMIGGPVKLVQAPYVPLGHDSAFALTGTAAIAFTEADVNTSPQLIDADVTFTAVEGNLDGAVLRLAGALAEDSIGVRHGGSGPGEIGVSGSTILYEGLAIGTLAGGAGTTLSITFGAGASAAAVEALIESLTYANSSDEPTPIRTLTLTFEDGAGHGLAAPAELVIGVTQSSDLPHLSGFAEATIVFAENAVNGTPRLIDARADFVGQEGGGKLVVSGLLAEDRIGILDGGLGAGVIGTQANRVYFGGGQIGTFTGGAGTPFVVTFNNSASSRAIEALIESLTYANASDAPTSGRTLQLDILDSDDVGLPAPVDIAITVTSENDAPVLGDWGGSAIAWNQSDFVRTNQFDITISQVANDFTLGAPTQLAGFSAWLADGQGNDNGIFDNFSGTLGWAIYSGTDHPETIVASGSVGSPVATDTGTQSWFGEDVFRFDGAFDAPVTLGAGTYWFALREGAWGDTSLDFTSIYWQDADSVAGHGYASFSDMAGAWVIDANDGAFTLTAIGPIGLVEGTIDPAGLLLDADITLSDPDGALGGGSMVVAGLMAGDRVAIRSQGSGAGEIGVAGSGVTYGGVLIGHFSGGNGSAFRVDLDPAATVVAVEALIESLTFANDSDTPAAQRILTLTVTDGGGAAATAGPITIEITAVNDAPTLQLSSSAPGAILAYTENDAAALIAPDALLADADSPDFAGGTLSVRFQANGTGADQLGIRHQGIGPGQIGVDAAASTIAFAGTVFATFSGGTNASDLVFNFDSDATAPAVQALIRSITFANNAEDPSGAPRTISFLINDSDGGTATAQAEATVNVTPVNDLPAGTDRGLTILEDTSRPLSAADFGFSDADGTFTGVTISAVTGGRIQVDTDHGGSGGFADVTMPQTIAIADLDGGWVRFVPETDGYGPAYSAITFSVIDEQGAADPSSNTLTFDVTPVNDAPLLTSAAPIVVAEQIAATLLGGVTVSDADLDKRNGGLGDYAGATFSVQRNGGANAEDVFSLASNGSFTVDGDQLKAGGRVFGTVSTGSSGTIEISFTSLETPATSALVDTVIQAIRYTNGSDTPPASVELAYGFADGAPGGGQGSGAAGLAARSISVAIDAINDAPINVAPISQGGSEDLDVVFSAARGNPITASDAEASTLTVTLAVTQGMLSLAETAALSFSAGDGTRDAAMTFSGTAAAINAALDGLVYRGTLNQNGAVTLTITTSDLGVAGSGGARSDQDAIVINLAPDGYLDGDSGDNDMVGTGNADMFLLHQGGHDHARGNGLNDRFYFGDQWDSGDSVDGGSGDDSLILGGDYFMAFGSGQIAGVERLRLLSGKGADFDYHLTMTDGNVAAGQQLRVDASELLVGETLFFDGMAESDGRWIVLGGGANDIILGGMLADTISGGAGDDTIYGKLGRDQITGGLGADFLVGGSDGDVFVYGAAAESTGTSFDTFSHFGSGIDRIDLPFTVTAWTGRLTAGVLNSATFDSGLAAAVDGPLQAHSAVLFTPNSGDMAGRVFAVVDADGDGAYRAGQDYVFEFAIIHMPLDASTAVFI
ncbi:tandem-95 repeat protein [Sphingosinicella sp. BN140058]|uniref:tandem-95 repeat protein n=1 Tax=Sphingosinicella sp. BN140058 TaxID=1892855 RepID=UPI0010136595|nr:tandem-95 repeat protein [Sphingosinicella sp. BN140058]QAY76182.1 tandem-95 repeat protein [Sphingosinicella sp. BN140058]